MYTLHSFNFFKSISNIIMRLGKATRPPISQILVRPLAHPPAAASLSPVAMPTLLQATELRTTDLLLTPQSLATQQQSKTKVATPKLDGGYSSSNVSADSGDMVFLEHFRDGQRGNGTVFESPRRTS